jgi:hypothetical protein
VKHDIDVHLQKLSRGNTAAGRRQKPSGPQTGADRGPMTDTQIKQVRQTVLFDMRRFMLKDNASASSFGSGLAQKFLARPPFRRWLERNACLEIYNRLYIKDPHISSGPLEDTYRQVDQLVMPALFRPARDREPVHAARQG